MNFLLLRPFVLSGVLTVLCACVEQPARISGGTEAEQVRAVVVNFYREHIAEKGAGGLPDAPALSKWSPFLSPGLVAELQRARQCQLKARASFPDEKPPLADGELFGSLFEGIDTVTPAKVEIADNHAQADTAMSFTDPNSGTIQKWQDKVILVRTDSGWRIDDVAYGGQWDFANQGYLRAALASVTCNP